MAGVVAGCAGHAAAPPPQATPTVLAAQPPSNEAADAVATALQAVMQQRLQYSTTMTGARALGGEATASGMVDLAGTRGSMALELGGRLGSEQLLFTPSTVYIHQPGRLMPNTLPWLAYSATDTGALSAAFSQVVAQSAEIDPGFTLTELAWGVIEAAGAGPGTVAGVPMTRYRATVNLGHAQLGATRSASAFYLRGIQAEAALLGPTARSGSAPELTVEVDIDASGRLLRISRTPPGGDLGTVTMTFHETGVAVAVVAPPSDQTTDIATVGGSEHEPVPHADGDGS